jgi:dihydrofolate synthase / folylpolyglutamate synthase
MNYSQTLTYLYEKLPMFSRLGAAAYKPDLVNTLALCERLGNPQDGLKTIHIAGTNGKGSVSHMLAAILQQAGYKTGLYTSPHLKDFRERIRINGIPCSEQFVIDFTQKIDSAIDAIQPSFFEITVAMAFDYFRQEQVDIAIIETGLGGRLDSTNVIHPMVSVITSIGMDHMNLLGDNLEAIAGEKAGIIKKEVPVVIGKMDASLYPLFEKVVTQVSGSHSNSLFHLAVREWEVVSMQLGNELNIQVRETITGNLIAYSLDLPGIYQQNNLLCVLSTIRILQQKGWNIQPEQIKKALQQVVSTTGLHGRWETLQESPRVIADVAHNEDGIRQLVQQLNYIHFQKLYIIIGMVKDKDVNRVLSQLPKTAAYIFSQAFIPRAMPADQLQQIAQGYHLSGEVIPNVNDALEFALSKATKDDLILVCGSVFLVGELDAIKTSHQ